MSKLRKICVHSGNFHADEALSYYMLKLLPRFKNAQLFRSRDPKKWEEADIVVDVGGKYDGVKFFDHHQRDFYKTFNNKHYTKLSSAGLIFKHFGKDVIRAVLNDYDDEKKIDNLYLKMYKEFIEAIDANDNGIHEYDFDERYPPAAKYHTKCVTLFSVVANLNPNWESNSTEDDFFKSFLVASDVMGQQFINLLHNYSSWFSALKLVQEAFDKRFETHSSGRILILDRFCPWKEHLQEVERQNKANNKSDSIYYVLFPDVTNSWRIAAVPVNPTSFTSRKALPEPWRGLRDEELSKATGVEGCVFIHASGFIGGCKTREGTLELASESVEWK
ncbi:Myg1p [Ascoidea rubescens DSM 1968]|uniref:Metal-dependent protein hydrolase n=1 Tax=Ascoidea rubescens DSM 1968 TaxID=1344418 RepID=A0A1D2VQB4_9ASCO|nr:metal-dependent protein hydrolase [Ascoidea rubescens DSM 1968]ODV63789.1 metal-dependent protein hydrolase [Ascoidea rubescens DSM 1968]